MSVFEMLLNAPNYDAWSKCWDNYIVPKQHKEMVLVVETGNQPLSPPTSSSSLSPKQDINPFDVSYSVSVPPLPKNAFRMVKENNKHFFECTMPDCGKRFTRRAENAKAHWLLHHKITPFVCSTCGVGFRRKHDLKRHISSAHPGLIPKSPSSPTLFTPQ